MDLPHVSASHMIDFCSFIVFWLELIDHVAPGSAVQHRDPVTYTRILFLILSFIMFYPKRLDRLPCALILTFPSVL